MDVTYFNLSLSSFEVPVSSEYAMIALVQHLNIPIDFSEVIWNCIQAKYTVQWFSAFEQKIISREKKDHRRPGSLLPSRWNGECYRFNALTELDIKICEKRPDLCIKSAVQTEGNIESFVVALLHAVQVDLFD